MAVKFSHAGVYRLSGRVRSRELFSPRVGCTEMQQADHVEWSFSPRTWVYLNDVATERREISFPTHGGVP